MAVGIKLAVLVVEVSVVVTYNGGGGCRGSDGCIICGGSNDGGVNCGGSYCSSSGWGVGFSVSGTGGVGGVSGVSGGVAVVVVVVILLESW